MAMVASDPSNPTEEIAPAATASSDVGKRLTKSKNEYVVKKEQSQKGVFAENLLIRLRDKNVLIVVGLYRLKEHHMHKNRLQEYTQRSGLSLPCYSTFNEGESHAPRFRATILVDGMKFTSPYTFSHRKEAEQDVAKRALEIISVKFKNEASLKIHKDPTFCKLILNEYGAKLKKDRPTYTTTQQDGLLPIFITTVTFDEKTYVGFIGRSKKEAEQNAACGVIDSILANSNTVAAMAQIIKTKGKLYDTVNNIVNAGNATLTSEIKIEDAEGVIEGTGLTAVAPIGNLPTGPASWVPFNSQLVDISQSNQMNYHIPSSSFPMVVVDSQAIVPKKKKKKLKKRKADQSKRKRVDELPSDAALSIA